MTDCSHADHAALRADRARWQALPLKYLWKLCGEPMECRECPRCGSDLLVQPEGAVTLKFEAVAS